MLQAIIRTENRFEVISYGNGLAYALRNKATALSVLFQDEADVAAFKADLDHGYKLSFLWFAYQQFAVHDGEVK